KRFPHSDKSGATARRVDDHVRQLPVEVLSQLITHRLLPSIRYGSFKVDTSNHPSAAFRRPTSAPQSVISPFIKVTCAPVCSHSITFARGVSRGMKMNASNPARAAYAASAPAALPADGTASFFAPNSLAIETAVAIPRALKLCVGFCPSSLI